MALIKNIARTVMLAIALLTFTELALSLTGEFSDNIGVMQVVGKYHDQVGTIAAKAPDLNRAVNEVVNLDTGVWYSYLQSIPLRLQGLTFDVLVSDLLNFGDSPLSWIIIGLVGWQTVWKVTGGSKIEI